MRNRNNTATSEQGSEEFDHNVDRFLSVNKALTSLIQDENVPDIEAELIEIRPQANGEIAWRVRPPRAEEFELGLWTP